MQSRCRFEVADSKPGLSTSLHCLRYCNTQHIFLQILCLDLAGSVIPIFLLDMALGSDGPGGNHGQFLLSGRCKAMRIRSVGSRHTNTRSLAVSFFFFFWGQTLLFWLCISWMVSPPPALHIFVSRSAAGKGSLEGHHPTVLCICLPSVAWILDPEKINGFVAVGVVFRIISLPVNILNWDSGTPASLLSLLWEERTTSMPADLCLNLSLLDPILVSRSLLQDWASARCLYSWL